MYLFVAIDVYIGNICPCRQAGTTEQTALRPGHEDIWGSGCHRDTYGPGAGMGPTHGGRPGGASNEAQAFWDQAGWVLQVGVKKPAAMGLRGHRVQWGGSWVCPEMPGSREAASLLGSRELLETHGKWAAHR